jgi:iron complex outermembrane receptor protein
LNASIYSSNYRNIQRTSQVGPATAIIINAEKARIQGIEVEAALVPAEWLKLDANYAYLDAKFIKYIDPINQIDLSATRFPLAPRHALGATATLILPTPRDVGQISLSANYAYRSATYFSVQGFQPEAMQKGYGLLNLRAQWNAVGGAPIDISLFAKNVTNKVFIAGTGNLSFNPNPLPTTGIDTVFYSEPRTYGVSVRFRFGG